MGLACCHKIEARLNSPHGRPRNDDVHAHWKFATNLDSPEWSTTFESALGTAPDFHQIAPESQHSPSPADDDDDDEPLPDLIDIITEPVTIRARNANHQGLNKLMQLWKHSGVAEADSADADASEVATVVKQVNKEEQQG
ncbi:MAG: hypothetical protein Q9194_007444 [Teloschistes cf. exilis]